MTKARGTCAKFWVHTAAPATGGSELENLQSVDLDLDGNPVDTSVINAATCAAAYTSEENTIKTIKVTANCLLDSTIATAGGQKMLWANWTSGTEVYVRIGYGVAGASPYYEFSANVKPKLGAQKDGFQSIDFDLSVADATTVTVG